MIRNEWPDQLTEQEILDHVVTHLLTQGLKSTTLTGNGAYRSEVYENCACAAGCLLTDAEAEQLKDCNYSAWWVVVEEGRHTPTRLKPHANLIADLQIIHDRHPPDKWASRLQALAEDRRLTYHGV